MKGSDYCASSMAAFILVAQAERIDVCGASEYVPTLGTTCEPNARWICVARVVFYVRDFYHH